MTKFKKNLNRWLKFSADLNVTSDTFGSEWLARKEEFISHFGLVGLSDEEISRLKTLKDAYRGKRIFVIGNGPSLNKTPLNLLKYEYTFGVNGIYRLYDKIDWKPTFYTITDRRVISDIYKDVNALTSSIFFFDEKFRGLLREDKDTFYFSSRLKGDNSNDQYFSYDISKNIRHSNTVVGWAIQIASYMGFEEIYLIGCDLGYKINDNVLDEGSKAFGGKRGMLLTGTQDDDPNHFDPSYFGRGRKWHVPNEKGMIFHHEKYRDAIEGQGKKIMNATIGGVLEAYPRINFYSLFYSINKTFDRKNLASLDEIALIANLLKELTDGLILDIGACGGGSSKPFIKMGWRSICFEPSFKNIKILRNTFKNEKKVTIDTRAVSDIVLSDVPFYESPVSNGISSILPFHHSHKLTQKVNTTTVSEIISEYKINTIDFLKVDVEGYDFSVLKGVPWEIISPNVVMCEFENLKTEKLGHTWEDVCNYLIKKGYAIYISEWHPIIEYGTNHNWRGLKKYPCNLDNPCAWGNILAFKKDPGLNKIQKSLIEVLKVKFPEKNLTNTFEDRPNTYSRQSNSKTYNSDYFHNKKFYRSNVFRGKFHLKQIFSNTITYSFFAEWVKSKNITLFRIGQLVMWVLRFILRNKLMSTIGFLFISSLAILPLFVKEFKDYDMTMWGVAFFSFLSFLSIPVISFLNKKITEFSERNLSQNQQIKNKILQEFENKEKSLMAELDKFKRKNDELFFLFNSSKQKQAELDDQLQLQNKEQTSLKEEVSTQLANQEELTRTIQRQVQKQAELDDQLQLQNKEQTSLKEEVSTQLANQEELTRTIQRQVQKQAELDDQLQLQNKEQTSLKEEVSTQLANQEELTRTIQRQVQKQAELDDQLQLQNKEQTSLKEEVSTQLANQEELTRTIQRQVQKQAELDDQLQLQNKEQTSLKEEMVNKISNNRTYFENFNRKLEGQHFEEFKKWSRLLNIPYNKNKLAYLADKICNLEIRSKGRLATSIENMLLRLLVTSSVQKKNIKILEIGTLFGIGLTTIYDNLHTQFQIMKLTAIDPLEGYYNQNPRDVVTDELVNEKTLNYNLKLVGLDNKNFQVIKDLSTSETVLKKISKQSFDVLIIDGDHSYAGVKSDFVNFLPYMNKGGYVIFDDYHSKDWPGVTEFVDQEVVKSEYVAFVGAGFRSAVFKVIKK